jgi:hypothetical protein
MEFTDQFANQRNDLETTIEKVRGVENQRGNEKKPTKKKRQAARKQSIEKKSHAPGADNQGQRYK